MPGSWIRRATVTTLCLGFLAGTAGPAMAQRAASQTPASQQYIVPLDLDGQRANDVRDQLRRVLERYPPALGRVLKIDPALMTNEAYLAPYPALAAFLRQHPEVPRYTGYFLNFISDSGNSYEPRDPDSQMRNEVFGMWRNTLEGITVFTVFLTVTFTLAWLVRFIVNHRRWIRATKVQSDVHNRVLERLTSNDELLAYIQSPAGSHFLQSSPISTDATAGPNMSAPLGRILLSVQAGLVLACGGVGLLAIKRYVIEEVGQMLLVMGVLGISLGAGFVLAATASYILSQRLGLFGTAASLGRGETRGA